MIVFQTTERLTLESKLLIASIIDLKYSQFRGDDDIHCSNC